MTTADNPEPPEVRLSVVRSSAPEGFIFPLSYLDAAEELDDIDPLFWLLEMKDALPHWTDILRRQFPDRVLVPFAKDGDSDDVYCFDGNDRSGNPPVLLIHSFTDPEWEYRGEWNDFDSWHRRAKEYHAQWLEDPDQFGGVLMT